MKDVDKWDEIPQDLLEKADVLSGQGDPSVNQEPYDILSAALLSSIQFKDEGSILENNRKIGIIVNDRNRPTPTYLFFRFLKQHFKEAFPNIQRIHIATGSHKEPKSEEIQEILGDCFTDLKDRVHIHRSRDKASHREYGTTSRGNALLFDKALDGHDHFIFLNSVEPHYFAGFTGGRKSIIPGMAHHSTIEYNHRFALDEGSKTLGLEGNPVHEDMKEAVDIFLKGREHTSIQLVQGPGKELTSVHIGSIHDSFCKGVEDALKEFCVPVNRKYDVVVSFARPPMDKTLYQSQKAIENGKLALKEGGTLVLVASCSEGIGQSTFWDLLTSSDDPDEILSSIQEEYRLGYHKAAKIVGLSKVSHIKIVGQLDQQEVAKGFMKGYKDLGSALSNIEGIRSPNRNLLVIPDGTVTVPHFTPKEQ